MMTNLTVALAQTYPQLGDVRGNLQRHLDLVDQAAGHGANLIVFPELSLTGYYLKDLVSELATSPSSDDPTFRALLESSIKRTIDIIVGFVEEDERGRYFISSAYLSQGTILHVHRKVYLPTYGLFDDGRYFASGSAVRAFDTSFGRFGMLICEDFWHMSLPYVLWQDGADVMIFSNASPGRGLSRAHGIEKDDRLGSARWVEMVTQAYGGLLGNFVIQVNRVGFEDGLVFWGGSTVVDPEGQIVTRAPYFEEDLLFQTIDLNQVRRTRSRLPLLRDERPQLMLQELTRILKP